MTDEKAQSIIARIEKEWSSLKAGRFMIDGFQFLSERYIVVVFEDGHNVWAMVVENQNGTLSAKDSFSCSEGSCTAWKDWMAHHGERIVRSEKWFEDTSNSVVGWLYK